MKGWMTFLLSLVISGVCYAESFRLELEEADRRAITEIITSIGEKNWARLLWDSSHLRELGRKIDHVPPLQFIGYIIKDPRLKKCLQKAHKGYFQWASFMDGFAGSMNRYDNEEVALKQLRDFAEFMGVNYDTLERHAYNQDWEEFVKFLLYQS